MYKIWSRCNYAYNYNMPGSRKFCQRGSNFDRFFFAFLVDEEVGSKYHYWRAISGPPGKSHLNGILLACRWWPNIDSFVTVVALWFFRGSETVLLRNPIFLWFFRGGGCPDPLCPLWIRSCITCILTIWFTPPNEGEVWWRILLKSLVWILSVLHHVHITSCLTN